MYTFISLLILLLSYYLFKKVSGSLKLTQLNMISWIFFYNLILQSFIASVLVVNNLDNHYLISKISNEDSRFYGWLAVQYTMVMMPLGMLFVINLFGYKNNNRLFQEYVHSPIKPFLSLKDSYIRYPFYILSVISVFSVLYVMASLKSIPIAGIFQGLAAEELARMRIQASREFSGNEYVKNIFALGLTPILSYVAFTYYKMTKTKFDLSFFVLLALSSSLILTYDIAKAPLIEYFLGFIFLTVLINGSLKRKTLFFAFFLVIIVLITMYFLIAHITDASQLFSYNGGIIGRIILSQAAGTYLSFDIFPSIVGHIGFSSVSSFLNSLFDLENSERSARLLMEHTNPKAVEAGLAGVINSLFIAEAWADFGLLGVLIAPFYVGVVIQTLFMFFLKMPKTPLLLGLFTYFSYKGSVTGGFNDYLYNAGYFVIIIFFVWIYFSGLALKQMKGKRFEKNNISPSFTSK